MLNLYSLLPALDRFHSNNRELTAVRVRMSIPHTNRAAHEPNMSYRKAWGLLRAMEEQLGVKLIGARPDEGYVDAKFQKVFMLKK